jgi:dihydrofolate reductase
MRKVVASEFVSVDGIMENPGEWQGPYFDEELGGVVGEIMSSSDAMLLGRVTHQEFAPFWSTRTVDDDEGAEFMNGTTKYVVSGTLRSADWQNSVIVGGDPVTEIGALKQSEGGTIAVMGSGQLVRGLLSWGLLDELVLVVHPLILGRGKRLFDGGGEQLPLTHLGSRTLSSGVVVLTYGPSRG